MKKRYQLLLSCAVLMGVLVTGCGTMPPDNTDVPSNVQSEQEQPPEPITCVYTEALLSFKEPHGDIYQEKYAWATQHENITYHFASKISEEERNAIVNEFVRLLALVEERFGALDGAYVVNIRQDAYAPWSYDNTMYISTQNLETQALTTALAQMLFGHEVNYGLCYAFGAELAREAGYPVEELTATNEQILALCREKQEYLDMNYACFIAPYTDEATIPVVKAIAVDFYNTLTQEERTDLMRQYSHTLYGAYLTDYLHTYGVDGYIPSALEDIAVYPCGGKMRLAWEDTYAKFYVLADYEMRYKTTYDGVEIDPTNDSYYYFRRMVTDFHREGEVMDNLVGRLETEELRAVKCHVLFENNYNSLVSSGAYSMQDGYIRLYSTSAYAHEYVHYVTRDYMSSILELSQHRWRGEAMANFCSMRPGVGDGAAYEEIFQTRDAIPSLLAWIAMVEDHLGRPIAVSDLVYLVHASIVAGDLYSSLDGSGTFAPTSFSNYLADLVGEEQALDALYHNTPEETFGKSWTTLQNEWKAWLNSEFSWVYVYMTDEA